MEPCAAAPFAYGVFLSQLLLWLAGLLSQSRPVDFANFPKGDGKPSQSAPAGRVQLPPKGELWISAGQHKKLSLRESWRGSA